MIKFHIVYMGLQPDDLSSRIIVLLQDGEREAGVAQGPDNCLQCAQVPFKFYGPSCISFFDIFRPQGGQVKEWN